MKNNKVGEIIQVEGGHVIKATGKKDRHSKVYTAKGPRDRRIRLSANTAIQFYDVQDRLGYDRPSKAIDWLLKKAKYAIDKLQENNSTNKIEISSNTTDQELLFLGSNSVQFEQNYSNLVYNQPFCSQSQNSDVFTQRESLPPNESQNLLQYSWNERMLRSLNQQIIAPQSNFPPCLYNFYFGSNFQPNNDQIHGLEEH